MPGPLGVLGCLALGVCLGCGFGWGLLLGSWAPGLTVFDELGAETVYVEQAEARGEHKFLNHVDKPRD